MSRNYGAGTRDMRRAGAYFAKASSESYSSQSTLANRFNKFVEYLKDNNVKRLEQVTKEVVQNYAVNLKNNDYLSVSTKHNLLSAVNVIMREARKDNAVKVTAKEVGIDKRNNVATEYKGSVDRNNLSDRVNVIVNLANFFGLRFEEASKLNAVVTLKQAINNSQVKIELGTKGGQSRIIPVTTREQIQVLVEAAKVQYDAKSLIHPGLSYKQHKTQCYRETSKFHVERHAYANQRYSVLMHEKLGINISSPVLSDKPAGMCWRDFVVLEAAKQGVHITPSMAREFDRDARLQLSKELGHHREDVVSRYIGGQR